MFNTKPMRAFFGLAAAVLTVATAQGCVADRPSRNGVFNENQYLRKDFLVRPATDGSSDPGWYMKATIVQTSTPNPLANLDLFTGAENTGAIVRFVITQDKLQVADMRELTNSQAVTDQGTRTPTIVNAWPATNVDLKYRVNLDGEKTNFYEENQELDWQVRQWVKINFDKNDLSDIAGLGSYQELMLGQCTDIVDSSASLVPGSFKVDEANNYIQWTVSVTVPLDTTNSTTNADCMTAFGGLAQDFARMGRSNVTLNVMYSMVRAQPVDPTAYTPLVIPEKDSIRHKYGPIEITNWSRDPDTGLVAARQLAVRYNPAKPFVWYFAKGYPEAQKDMWTRATGIVAQTNAVLKKAGAAATLSVLNYNDDTALGDAAGPERVYGDIRYNFIRWESDYDTGSPFLAVTQFQPDLRTGEIVSGSINVADEPLKDYIGQRIQAYLEKVVGQNPSDPKTDIFADPPPGQTSSTCTTGQTIPLTGPNVTSNIYAQSTLYQKMAQYLPKPLNGTTSPGPDDWAIQHTGDDGAMFYKAYLAFIPFITYADPTMNQFVTTSELGTPPGVQALPGLLHGETLFQQAIAAVDHGNGGIETAGNGPTGMLDLYNKVDDLRQKWQMHRDYTYKWKMLPHSLMRGDTADLISFTSVAARASRMCVNGKWESHDEWLARLMKNTYEQTVWHEFGHIMGLEHNFMGSVDKANWPSYKAADGTTQYGKYSSSLMEYSQSWDDATWNDGKPGETGWLPYDQAAIAFIYGNNLSASSIGPVAAPAGGTTQPGISGQVSAKVPWNDPYGFNGATETNFLYCSHQHIRFTPLCRMFDVGSTPSEIAANEIESYDWNYKWRNYRNYYKTWDDSAYGSIVSNMIGETRRFIAMDNYDWSTAELTGKLLRIGISPPPGSNSGLFYAQLANHFVSDIGMAEQLLAAFHEAIIQQGTGQRPFTTQFDPYFGDVTQQGIAIDKELAFINWLGIWPYDNYDPSQANGYYASSMTVGPEDQGATEPAQAWSTASSMLGEKGPWDAYPGFFPAAVSLFAHDTQTATFTSLPYPQMRDWIGGKVFTREQDAIDYFKNLAVQFPHTATGVGCADFTTCTYNPMTPQVSATDIGHSVPATQAFIGPDNRRWTWVYIADRNVWFFTDQDRNPSSYYQVFTYNQDVNTNYDDGNIGPVFTYDAKIKYMIDAYKLFGGDQQAQ